MANEVAPVTGTPIGDVLLLTAAGASVGVGIPAMDGMVQEYRQHSSHRDALDLLDTLRVPADLEETLLGIDSLLNFPDRPDYRLLRNVLSDQGGKISGPINRSITEATKSLEALREDILSWLIPRCLRFNREAAEKIWSPLCPVLADKRIPVYTTNYDCSLEETARTLGVPVADNFEERQLGRRFWDPSLNGYAGPGLQIVKLHGSVDWYTTQERQDVERADGRMTENREGETVQPVIVFPTRFKDIYARYYFPLYQGFLSAVAAARVLIVVGHSLRDEYLRAAVREGFRDPKFHLVYVGPKNPDWDDVFTGADDARERFAHLRLRFETAADGLAYILSTESVENLVQSAKQLPEWLSIPCEVKQEPGNPRVLRPGEAKEFKLRISGAQFEPVTLRARLNNGHERSTASMEWEPTIGGQPRTLHGPLRETLSVAVAVPQDAPTGPASLRLGLANKSGEWVIFNEYKVKVRNS